MFPRGDADKQERIITGVLLDPAERTYQGMNKRVLTLVALLLLVFPLLAACGGEGTTTTTGGDTTEQSPTETDAVGDTPTETDAAEEVPTVAATAAATAGATVGATAGATAGATMGATAAATGAATAGATAAATGAATAGATAEGDDAAAGAGGTGCQDKNITIGSKNFTEQLILGELYAQALEAKGYTVERKLNLGSEQIADRALLSGQIDMYPEYTGTMLQAILKSDAKPKTPEETYEVVKEAYAKRNPSITLLESAPFNNNFGIVVTREAAEQYNLKTIEDVAKNAQNLVFASYGEFEDRGDARPNVEANYPGFANFKQTRIVNSLGLRYAALESGDADVGVGFLTDGQLTSENLVVVEDTKGIWPYYYPTPAIRAEYLEQCPEAATILNSVSEKLTLENMQELNGLVDLEREDPADVASDFLKEQGLK